MRKRHDLRLQNIGQNFPQSLPSRSSQFMRLEEGENFLKNAVGGIVSRCWALSCITEAHHLS